MSNTAQWEIDRDSYFSKRRTAPLPKAEQKKEVKVEQKPETTTKPNPAPKKQETDKNSVIDPFMTLVNCIGVALFHGMVQFALYYVFVTGAIDPDGLMIGSMANCSVAGFRVCWRFKP